MVLGPRARDVVYAPKVLAPLFDALLDRSSTRKRELALRVLGRLAAHAGCVVAPYLEHAPLLPRVLAVVCENSAARATREDDKPLAPQHATWSLCREAVRTVGLLGALDPYAFDVVQRSGRDARPRARKRALPHDLLAPHRAARNPRRVAARARPVGELGLHCWKGSSTSQRSIATWPVLGGGTRPRRRLARLSRPEQGTAPQPARSAWPPP